MKSVVIEIGKDAKEGTTNIPIDKIGNCLVQIRCYSEKKQS